MIKYYKHKKYKTLKYFCYNDITDNIEGLIEEVRSEGMVVIHRNPSPQYYSYASNNKSVMAMLKESEEISKEEYNIADAVSKAIIEQNSFVIASEKVDVDKTQEVKLEPVFAD